MNQTLNHGGEKSQSGPSRARRLLAGATAVLVLATPAAPSAAAGGTAITVPISSKTRKSVPLPAGDKIELTLDQAISLALQNVLDLDVAAYSYEKAAFSIGSADGAFDPYVQLDLSARKSDTPTTRSFQSPVSQTQTADATFGGLFSTGATYRLGWTNTRTDSPVGQAPAGYVEINPTYESGLTLSLTQPLLRNFGKTVSKRLVVQARIGRDQAAWSFVQSVQGTVQNVENAYWDLAYAYSNLQAKLEALDRAKDLNRITKIKIDVGALAPIDIVQTEVTIAQREQDIILAEGAIGDAQDRIRRLLNVSSHVDWARPIVTKDAPSFEPITLDVAAGLKKALETRPEVKQAVVDIESKKVSLAFNRNQLLPRLDASGSYGYSGVGAANRIETDNGVTNLDYVDALYQIRGRQYPAWQLGLVLNVPIGNRTARNQAASAATDLELSRTNLAILKQNLQVEVQAAARGVGTAVRSVAAAKKSRELAERNLDAEKKKYENGMTTSFQVSQVQNDLTSARSFELQAISAYQKALTSWHRAIGDLLEQKSIAISGLPVTLDATPAEEGALR